MKWFRLYHEFATDPKVQMMPEVMQRRLVMLFCMKSGNVAETLHETDRATAIAFYLRISDAELDETKRLFLSKGFIDEDWNLVNWEKRQFASDSSTARSRKHRENKKEGVQNDATLQKRCRSAIDTDTDTDTEKNINPNGLIVASEPDDKKPKRPDKPDCPHQKIIYLYHEVLPMCPRIRDWTPARATQLRARWNEATERQNLDYWKRFFEYVATCDFLVGRTKNPFFANLEWMVKAKNFAKIREGHYENREAT